MEYLRHHQFEITLVLAVLVIIQFGLLLGARARLAKLSRMMRTLFAGPEGIDLEAILKTCLAKAEAAIAKGHELDSRLEDLSFTVRGCIQHFGLVRYDAYGDVSGQQSFSLAILDADRNGAVISGLFSRSDSRCYGKVVVGGTPEQTLTEEEQNALDLAISNDITASAGPNAQNGRRRLLRR